MAHSLLAAILSLLLVSIPAALMAETAPPARWTAQEALGYAIAHNPDAKAALERIQAAKADIKAAKAAFYPRLDVGAEYNRTNNPMYSFGNILNQGQFDNTIDFNDPGVTDTLQTKAALQYRLYNGGRDQAGLDAAEQQGQAVQAEEQAIRDQLGFEVIRAFYTIIQAEETVQARKAALEAASASLAVAQARYQEGSLLKEDLLNLEVQQSKAQEQCIQAEHGLSLAQRAFLHLLGLPGATVQLDAAASQSQEIPVDRTIANRPELAGMQALIKTRDAQLRQARSGYYPTADAFGSYQHDQGIELENGSGNSWTAGLKLNYSLFDGQQTAAATAKAQAQLAEAREQQRKLELAFNLEMEQAALALKQEDERLRVTAKMVESAGESARLARLRFKEGVLLASELIDTENRLTDAQVSHALASASRKIAIAGLRRAIGAAQFK